MMMKIWIPTLNQNQTINTYIFRKHPSQTYTTLHKKCKNILASDLKKKDNKYIFKARNLCCV